jgi:hypothetical protein
MTAQELLSLAERVERATGADRLLDANILWAIKPDEFEADADEEDEHLSPSYCYARGGWTMNRADHYYLNTIPVPRFTASVDAALTLVPEGVFPRIYGEASQATIVAWTDTVGWEEVSRSDLCHSSALALCAAALRARASSEAGGRG